MLNLQLLRTHPDEAKASLARRGEQTSVLDEVLVLDERRRDVIRETESLRAEVNQISAKVGAMFREGRKIEANELRARSRELSDHVAILSGWIKDFDSQINGLLLSVPNLPSDECPDGISHEDNVIVRVNDNSSVTEASSICAIRVGDQHRNQHKKKPQRSYEEHQRFPHWDTGEALQILDMNRAVRMSGAMFAMYRGLGARLVRALISYGLDRNRDAYEEIRPPTLVRTETMTSTGHLPKFIDDAYHLERDDLWAIPTSEVALTSLLKGEIVDEADLPIRLMAHTSCFRREAGAAGSKTRGLLRVHEFDKVELYGFCTPSQAADLHMEILERAQNAIADLGLAYRVLDLCAGDLGEASARTFDLEVYSPGVDRWLEVSSVSWCRDYQARRADIRFRPGKGGRTQMVHTLNGSGLAVPRVWGCAGGDIPQF